jgi:hypothetical protein
VEVDRVQGQVVGSCDFERVIELLIQDAELRRPLLPCVQVGVPAGGGSDAWVDPDPDVRPRRPPTEPLQLRQ